MFGGLELREGSPVTVEPLLLGAALASWLLLLPLRNAPTWQGALLGSSAWALAELARGLHGPMPFPLTLSGLLAWLGGVGWLATVLRLEPRRSPRWTLTLIPLGLLLAVGLLAQPPTLRLLGFAWVDLLVFLYLLPAIETALAGEASPGRILLGLGFALHLFASALADRLAPPPLGVPLQVAGYLLLGLGALWEGLGLPNELALGSLGLLIAAGSWVGLIQDPIPWVLAVALLLFLYAALGLLKSSQGRQARSEEELNRWVSLLEQLALVSPRPTQSFSPEGVLQALLSALRTAFPTAVGLEVRSHEVVRVGQPAFYVRSFPLALEASSEVCLFFRAPPQGERSLEALMPFLTDRLRQALVLIEWRNQALSDPLTGLLNRRGLERELPRLVALAQKNRRPLTVAMIDLDYFKRVNDAFGHAVGDQVLVLLAEILRRHLRSEDLAVRWGGEEFSLFLYGAGIEEARRVLERIRSELRRLQVPPITWTLTLSAGLAGGLVPREGIVEHWILQADWALLQAKEGGRDQIRLGHPSETNA